MPRNRRSNAQLLLVDKRYRPLLQLGVLAVLAVLAAAATAAVVGSRPAG
jgi:hypothetical protein